MYRNLNIFLALIVFLLMFLIVPAIVWGADVSAGISAVWSTGHDHGGSHSINPGAGSIISAEIEPFGVAFFWLMNPYHKDNGHDTTKNKYLITPYYRPRWALTRSLDIYPMIGPTIDPESANVGILGAAGFDWWVSKDMAVSPMFWAVEETKENYYGVAVHFRYAL